MDNILLRLYLQKRTSEKFFFEMSILFSNIFDREYRSRGPRNTFDGDGDWTKIWKLLKIGQIVSKLISDNM